MGTEEALGTQKQDPITTLKVLEEKLGKVADRDLQKNLKELSSLHDKLQLEFNKVVMQMNALEARSLQQEATQTNLETEYKTNKDGNDVRHQAIQMQLATMATMATQSAASGNNGGEKTQEPLVTHKLIQCMEKLSGTESHQIVDEWYETADMNIDVLRPGAIKILNEALKTKKTPSRWSRWDKDRMP